jgi:hypothetical protein
VTYSPAELAQYACDPGKNIQSVNGHLWIKADSKEVSGQFPADIQATSTQQLKMVVTNLLGGTLGVISISGNHYEIIEGSGLKGKKAEGSGSWGGIPLRWASDLFLGKIPCPSITALNQYKLSTTLEDELVIESEDQKFVFRFKTHQGKPWPEALHWERLKERVTSVDFSFSNPHEKTKSPQRWEAKSSLGAVKVRWRDQEIQYTN